MNISGSVVGSATLSAIFTCRTCRQEAVCETTIITTGADIPEDRTRVSGRVTIAMPCKGCGRDADLTLDIPAQGDEGVWA